MSDELTTRQKPTTLARLAEHFPTGSHKKVSKGAGSQTYVPWTDAVQRMNEVLGADWSFRVVREGLTDTEAWVLGEITATIDGVVCARQHYGCESITKGQRETPVVDLFKIAASDAIRKAATLIGVGMYLSIKEERDEIEAEMRAEVAAAIKAEREANRPKPANPTQPSKPSAATVAPVAASTPGASSAEPSLSSTTATAATKPKPPQPAGYFCVECHGLVKTDGVVSVPRLTKEGTLAKRQDGTLAKVSVPVSDFAPVCENRLGGFHCPGCYEQKMTAGAA